MDYFAIAVAISKRAIRVYKKNAKLLVPAHVC